MDPIRETPSRPSAGCPSPSRGLAAAGQPGWSSASFGSRVQSGDCLDRARQDVSANGRWTRSCHESGPYDSDRHMKTTLNLDDRVLRAAKVRSAETGETLTRFVENALRSHLGLGNLAIVGSGGQPGRCGQDEIQQERTAGRGAAHVRSLWATPTRTRRRTVRHAGCAGTAGQAASQPANLQRMRSDLKVEVG